MTSPFSASLNDNSTPVAPCSVPFKLTQLNVHPSESTDRYQWVELVFTCAPDVHSLESSIRVYLDGEEVEDALLVHPSAMSKSVNVRIDQELLAPELGGQVRFSVSYASGKVYTQVGTQFAPAANLGVSLQVEQPQVSVHQTRLEESEGERYIQVLCHDEAMEQNWRLHYEDFLLSERCLPDLNAAPGSVWVEPATEIEVVGIRGGFEVHGDFPLGPLTLHVDANTPTVDGGAFEDSVQKYFHVSALQPSLSFISQGRYLPRGALDRLGVQHRNVDQIGIKVRYIPTDNLVFWMGGYREEATSRTSDLVLSDYQDVPSELDQTHTSWLSLSERLPEARNGLYEISLYARSTPTPSDQNADWLHDYEEREHFTTARVLLTDIQLVAKRAARLPDAPFSSEVLVWALDTHGSGPLPGVEIELVRRSGTVMGTCKTDSRGGCRIQVPTDGVDQGSPVALLARRGSDVSYLAFDDVELHPSGDVHGQSYLEANDIRAAVWADRGVYRPGDTIHVAAILRGSDNAAPSAGMPVTLVFDDPRGNEVRRQTVMSNASGMVAVDLGLHDYAHTGRYHIRLEVAEHDVGDLSVMVEEIVPERMAVALTPLADGLQVHEPAGLTLDASWLFGAAASGSHVELDCELRATTFSPPINNHLHYGASSLGSSIQDVPLGTQQSVLDAQGQGTLQCPPAETVVGFSGAARIDAYASVSEGTSGRVSRAWTSVPVHPERYYIGLSASHSEALVGVPVHVEGLLVDWEGQPLLEEDPMVQVQVFSVERKYGRTWRDGTLDYRFGYVYRQRETLSVPVAPREGGFEVEFVPGDNTWGYLVVATAGHARTELLLQGEEYVWDSSGMYRTPGPTDAAHLEISAPRQVDLGEPVSVSVDVEEAGWLLLSAETHEVLAHRWMRVEPGEAHWSFRVDEFVPNVYVSALLVRDPYQHSAAAYRPGRAHQVRSVRVRPEPYVGELSVEVPDEVRPRGTLEVEVSLDAGEGPSWVTVAAVDEGLLSLTRHRSPDPLRALHQPRALGVDSFETVGWSLRLPSQATTSAPGGDRRGNNGRVQSIEPVALWSGLVAVPASGRVTIPLELPDYRGALRIMAVGAGSALIATAEERVLVREPLLVQMTPPRFLLGGDRARVPVSISNLSGADRDVQISVRVEPLPGHEEDWSQVPLAVVEGPAQHGLHLAEGEQRSVDIPVVARGSEGAFQLVATVISGALHSEQRISLPLASFLPTRHRIVRVRLDDDHQDLTHLQDGWEEARAELRVTTNPLDDVLRQHQHLIQYPYGCLEQTSSRTRALLMLRTFANASSQVSDLDSKIQAGIDRIQMLQHLNGGFSYWPNGRRPSPWASVYAMHVLLDAQEAGYPVPADMMAHGLNYLESLLVEHDKMHVAAYTHYVLARAGRGQPAQARRILPLLGDLREDAYLLQAAVHLTGDHRYADVLMDLSAYVNPSEESLRRPYGSLLREQGMVLATFRELFGEDPAGQALTDAVAEGLRTTRGTTQEMAWGLTGLSRSRTTAELEILQPILERDGVVLPAQDAAQPVWYLEDLKAGGLMLRTDQDPETGLWAVLDASGTPTESRTAQSKGVTVRREVLTEAGTPADLTDLEVGQLLYVRLTAWGHMRHLDNVALVDRLPAGWEVENSMLSGVSLPPPLIPEHPWSADYVNLRDDRLEAFGSIDAKPRSIVYTVRVVTAGHFTLPGVLLEAMYAPDMYAHTAPTPVVVRPRAAVSSP